MTKRGEGAIYHDCWKGMEVFTTQLPGNRGLKGKSGTPMGRWINKGNQQEQDGRGEKTEGGKGGEGSEGGREGGANWDRGGGGHQWGLHVKPNLKHRTATGLR
jgi:hypothetical protein